MKQRVVAAPLALGTVKFGRNRDVKYPREFELPTDAELRALLEAALEMGVTLFDTAPAYGSSEERLRPFVEAHREEILICTKAGEDFGLEGSTHDFSPRAIRNSCERSLERLGCDAVDFLLLHSDGNDAEILDESGAVDALLSLREEGKARRVGISAKTDYGIRRGAELLGVVMAPFSVTSNEFESALRAAHDAGAFCLAIKCLASGHLAAVEDRAPAVERSLEFVFERDFIGCAVLGTTSIAHLSEAMAVARRMRGGANT